MNFNRVVSMVLLNNTVSETLNGKGRKKATRQRCFTLTTHTRVRLDPCTYLPRLFYALSDTSQLKICLAYAFTINMSRQLVVEEVLHRIGTGWDAEDNGWEDYSDTILSRDLQQYRVKYDYTVLNSTVKDYQRGYF